MKLFYKLLLPAFILSAVFFRAGAQNHFLATGDPTSAMNITIIEARFNGVDLEAGDEIGIFDGNVCVGAFVLVKSLGTYNDGNIAAARAFGNDPSEPGKGFIAGRTIKYRLWDQSEQFECSSDSIVSTCYTNQLVITTCGAFEVGGTAYVRLIGKSFLDRFPVAVNDAFSTNEDNPLAATVAANDTPSANGGNVWTALTTPGHGTFTFNTDGSFVYTPQANYNGSESFTYRLCDGDGDCVTASVTITISPVDDLPVAVADNVSTNEDTAVSGNLNTNDTSSGDGGNVWSKLTDPAHGTVVVGATGSFTYTPAANYNGSDSFTYQLCDADNDCSPALVTITVVSVSDLPVAVADNVTTNEDAPFTGNLASNDTPSPDGGNIWSKKTDPLHGSVVVQNLGAFTYMPAANYNGADSFVYQLCDVDGECVTAIVTITVTSVDEMPVAVPDNVNTNEDVAFTGNLGTNDILSPDGGNVWSKSTDPAHGAVVVQTSGSFTYTPAANYNGSDSFVYSLCDGDGDCMTATVSIVVNPVDDQPVAVDDVVTVLINVATTGNLASNDVPGGDGGYIYSKKTNPQHGTVTVNTNGTFTYTPVTDYTGADSFTYQLCDADNDCDEATVNISVFFNTFPTANADEFTTPEDTPLTGNLATNDYPSGDGGNVWAKVSDPLHGTVTIGATGSFTYSPAANYNGPDHFVYKVSDVDGETSTALVTITVTSVDDFPEAKPDYFTSPEDITLSGSLALNDVSSGDGSNLWSKVSDPLHGTLSIGNSGSFSYTPSAHYNGPDSFVYKLCDLDGDCDTAIVKITLTPVDDLPVAHTDYVTALEDNPLAGSVTANDSPSGDGGNTYLKLTNPLHGTVTLDAAGSFVYLPSANFNGSDQFTYQLCDGDNDCDTALVKITVSPVDDLPVATIDYGTTAEDTPLSGVLTGNDLLSGDGGNVWGKVINPAHGTVTVGTNGSFTYTPAANYYGTDSFVYNLCDSDNDCDTAKVIITITSVDDFPTAHADALLINLNTMTNGSLAGNDQASGDGGNVWSKVTNTSHGTVTVGSNGSYTYTPATGYLGPDSFIYQLCDGDGDCDTALVKITVAELDNKPVAVADYFEANEDYPLENSLALNDEPSKDGGNHWSLAVKPLHGTVNISATGDFHYLSAPDYNGNDSFIYHLCDGDGDCDSAIVRISVAAIDDMPVANNDNIVTIQNTTATGSLAVNDLPSGDGGNIWSLFAGPLHGTLTIQNNGDYIYVPDNQYFGSDEFTYKVCDGDNDCDEAVVKITVSEVDDWPVAHADRISVTEDIPFSGSLALNDKSSNNGGNIWTRFSGPLNGTVLIEPGGSFIYTPAPNYYGPDNFIYKLCDGDGDCDTALVLITVVKVNDLPVAGADDISTLEDTPVIGSVATNDFISGDGGTKWKKLTDPKHGTVIIGADGSFTYTPQHNYHGSDSFSYEICDVDNDCATGIVNISISSVNDKPFLLNSLSDKKVNTDRLLEIIVSPELGSVFNDLDLGDGLSLTFMKDNGNPLPSFITKAGDKLIVKPLPADLGCFNIVVTATDKGGAFETDTFRLCVVSDPVGIDDLSKGFEKVKVYPNPTSSHVTIDIGTIPQADLELRVLNLTGQSVMSRKIIDRLTIIDFSEQARGIYTVNIIAGQNYYIEKVIVR